MGVIGSVSVDMTVSASREFDAVARALGYVPAKDDEEARFSAVLDMIEPRMFFGEFGEFDAKNGNRDFMHGINCVMEYIAHRAGRIGEFSDEWRRNYEASLERAGGNG